jgi:hypothetical protein
VGYRFLIDCSQHFSRAVHRDVRLWFALGLAIASYEWMAAFTLIIVGNIFTHFIEKGIYTIPEFVESDFQLTLKRFYVFGLPYMFCKSYYSFVSGWFSYRDNRCDMMYAIIGLALLQQLIHCMADYLLWLD